jgi:hypothetical protein
MQYTALAQDNQGRPPGDRAHPGDRSNLSRILNHTLSCRPDIRSAPKLTAPFQQIFPENQDWGQVQCHDPKRDFFKEIPRSNGSNLVPMDRHLTCPNFHAADPQGTASMFAHQIDLSGRQA